MVDNKDNAEVIDLRVIIKKILANKKLFYKTLPVAFVLSSALILCVPRYYTTSLNLAPEVGGTSMEGALGSIASSFGLDIANMQTSDAISPLLYPDLIEDNEFIVGLFNVKVQSLDNEINTTYYEYLKKHQKHAWWNIPIRWIKKLFTIEESTPVKQHKKEFEPYELTKVQNDIAETVRSNITISIDKKTAIITVSAKAQDPLICKELADSVKNHLQAFITQYRTNKARIDEEYYKNLMDKAKQEYETARRRYGKYADANINLSLNSMKTELADIENDMQLKYNTYSTLVAQYQAAKAKVQERTPAFTVIKGAALPVKPAGPKRMIFVLSILFLTFIGTSMYSLRKDIKSLFNI